MRSGAGVAVAIALMGAGEVYYATFGLSHFCDLRLDDDGIALVAFRQRRVKVFKYSDIEAVETASIFNFSRRDPQLSDFYRATNIGVYPRLTAVRVYMKRGTLRFIAMTPKRPQAFAAEVRKRMESLQI